MRSIKRYINKKLGQQGYYKVSDLRGHAGEIWAFRERAEAIVARHKLQDEETVAALRQRYEQPIIGEVSVYRLLELMAQVIDPTNYYLYCTSQLTHALQVLDSMEEAGLNFRTNRELIIAALLHDLGKLALLKGELPEHVEGGGKRPLRQHEPGIGLDNCLFTWDHGDIVHARFKPHVSDPVAWLIRYHSITKPCMPMMDDRDRDYYERYYKPFAAHDRTYVFHRMPARQLEDYREIVEEAFPNPILF